MREIITKYSDMIRQNVRCEGKITNLPQGITIDLETKDYITKEEFLINFLNKFRTTYEMYANEYNQKKYKKLLAKKIKDVEQELEELKFAHKICGRKILNK